jgi:hypothetical protein
MFAMFAMLAVLASPRPIKVPASLSPLADGLVRVTIRTGTVSAPNSLPAGWTRLWMLADTPNHAPALFRLPDGTKSKAQLAAFLANLDTASATPRGALAMGGRIAADSGEIVVELAPGRYVFTCLTKDDGGHRHGIAGESRMLEVTRARAASSRGSRARVSMRMTDFAFLGPDRWAAGSYLVRVENVGRQDHQFRIARLPANVTADSAIRSGDPRRLVTPVTGLGRMGPSVAYLPVRLTPGTYLLFCLVHDPATGRTHDKLGMYRVIHVR